MKQQHEQSSVLACGGLTSLCRPRLIVLDEFECSRRLKNRVPLCFLHFDGRSLSFLSAMQLVLLAERARRDAAIAIRQRRVMSNSMHEHVLLSASRQSPWFVTLR